MNCFSGSRIGSFAIWFDTKLSDEFSFANPSSIHRIAATRRAPDENLNLSKL
jgi:hypothetical protein